MITRVLIVLFVVFSLIGKVSLGQITAPQLRCIYVEDNGDLTLTWIPSNDPNGQFENYFIYIGAVGVSNWVLATGAISNRLQNTFTYTGANFPQPSTPIPRFYIEMEYNDGSGKKYLYSDTLTVMKLDLTLTNPNTSGTLNWNKMRANPLPTWGNTYDLGRNVRQITTPQIPGTWDDDFAQPTYSTQVFNDTITRCSSLISYKVELKDASGCVSRSNVVTERLEDLNGVPVMTFTQITVNQNAPRGARMTWNLHPDKSVVRYVILHKDANGTPTIIDTLSANTTNYLDVNASRDPSKGRQCYLVVPIDSCGNTNGGGQEHCTIFTEYTTDNCAGEVYLKWSPYVGWGNDLDSYKIYMSSSNDTLFKRVGTVGPEDTTFSITGLTTLNTYNFYVEGLHKNGLNYSHSNVLRNIGFNLAGSTEFLYLRSASVYATDSVKLRVLMDRKYPIKHIDIYRGDNRKGPFKKIKSVEPPKNILDTLFTLYDLTARPSQKNYVYYLEVIDTCDMPVRRSNMFRTLFIQGESSKYEMVNALNWSENISVDSSAIDRDLYLVYRSINNSTELEPVRIKFKGSPFYNDDISELIHKGDKFCYVLKLAQTESGIYETPDTASSNEVCFAMEPDIFIANSFTPNNDGINETWRPLTSYVVPGQNYLLRIYDRWGKLVFETTDPLEGWDGTRNGSTCPAGQYIYQYDIITVYGSSISKKGSFNLIR
jgi:gliding motility-associated-like protein